MEQLLADDLAEDRVAEEFQPLVRREAMVGARGVRQRGFEDRDVLELVAQPALADSQAGIVDLQLVPAESDSTMGRSRLERWK